MTARARLLRLAAALAALAAGGAGIVVVAALLRSEPGPISQSAALGAFSAASPQRQLLGGRIATPLQPRFPAPPVGATVFGREAGPDALGLAVVPGRPRSLVRVSVVSAEGPGQAGLDVTVGFGRRAPARLSPCGQGCYQARVATGGADEETVRLDGRPYGFPLPTAGAAPAGGAIVEQATRVWRSLKTLVWNERLGSSPDDVLHTRYVAIAPDELAYTIKGLSAAVIIGGTRWDRSTQTGPWVRSVQDPPLQVPVPFWYSVSDAHVLGAGLVNGRSVWTVSFFDPTTAAWFEAEIDKQSGRTLELNMTAASHFMHHVYGPFNASLRLEPPR